MSNQLFTLEGHEFHSCRYPHFGPSLGTTTIGKGQAYSRAKQPATRDQARACERSPQRL